MWLNDFLFSVLTNFTAFAAVAVFQVPLTIFTNIISTIFSTFVSATGGS